LQGTFVETGKYWHRRGEWQLIKWETALPSRIEVKLPSDIADQIETAERVITVLVSSQTPWPKSVPASSVSQWRGNNCAASVGTSAYPETSTSLKSTGNPTTIRSSTSSFSPSAAAVLFRDEYIFDLPSGIAVEKPNWVMRRTCFPSPRIWKPSSPFTLKAEGGHRKTAATLPKARLPRSHCPQFQSPFVVEESGIVSRRGC